MNIDFGDLDFVDVQTENVTFQHNLNGTILDTDVVVLNDGKH